MNIYDVAGLNEGWARYWLAMDGWGIDDAASLLCGVSPSEHHLTQWSQVQSYDLEQQLGYEARWKRCRELLQNSADVHILTFPARPDAVIAWAMGKGLQLPALLVPADMAVKGGKWVKLGTPTDSTQPLIPLQESKFANEWVSDAQNRACEIIKEQKAKDLYPSQENIADQIAREFRAKGRVGADGKPISGAYIKRHALKGISSAQGRQLSTSIRQSK